MKEITPAIKIFEKKKYAEQFISGKIYFSAAGRFKKSNDKQRRYKEGMIRVNDQPLTINGVQFNIPYYFGYSLVDRVPIFCCTLLDPSNLLVDGNSLIYNIPVEHHEFGDYFVYFNLIDLKNKLLGTKYSSGIRMGKLSYKDFSKLTTDDYKDICDPFDLLFIHDSRDGHDKQNEYRIALTNEFINEDSESITIDIGKWDCLSGCVKINKKRNI